MDVGNLMVGIGTVLAGAAAVFGLRRRNTDDDDNALLSDRDHWRRRALDCEQRLDPDPSPRRRRRKANP